MENTTKRKNKERMMLGYNEIMIVSKYFNDINDFINLEIGIKRFQGNMERFHFNPIPLNQYSRKLFPNIETFHIYNKEDEVFEDGRIIKYVIWYKIDYSTYLQEKKYGSEYKNITYTKEDREIYGTTIPPEVTSLKDCFLYCVYNLEGSITIPTRITELGDNCFRWCSLITLIDLPATINRIGHFCFDGCTSLKSINIPTTVSEIGNRCFQRCSSLTSISYKNIQFIGEDRIIVNEQNMASIPIGRLKRINEKEIKPKNINEFVIPTTVTKLGNYCFENCYSLTSITIPTSVSEIGKECFYECTSLKSITIPTTISQIRNSCFSHCKELKSITIPTTITSFEKGCFYKCGCKSKLKKNKKIPKNCFKIWNEWIEV
ncbi:hypothetical protein ENUP19_0038G0032 [Entamoeba nuttalli]|uniref:Leucine rich repeat protein, BspA family protein n=1 Tax=Entamoeba nuttalli TaxID=412467 RepID=A0ABQ0D9M7_9EUKA